MKDESRRVIGWIEANCAVPFGADQGKPVVLSKGQRRMIRRIFDPPQDAECSIPVALKSYLALLHVCGPADLRGFRPKIDGVDPMIVWHSVGSSLRDGIERDENGAIICQDGTRYPAAA